MSGASTIHHGSPTSGLPHTRHGLIGRADAAPLGPVPPIILQGYTFVQASPSAVFRRDLPRPGRASRAGADVGTRRASRSQQRSPRLPLVASLCSWYTPRVSKSPKSSADPQTPSSSGGTTLSIRTTPQFEEVLDEFIEETAKRDLYRMTRTEAARRLIALGVNTWRDQTAQERARPIPPASAASAPSNKQS